MRAASRVPAPRCGLDPAWLLLWLVERSRFTLEHLHHIPADILDEPGILVEIAAGPLQAAPRPFRILIDGTHRAVRRMLESRSCWAYFAHGGRTAIQLHLPAAGPSGGDTHATGLRHYRAGRRNPPRSAARDQSRLTNAAWVVTTRASCSPSALEYRAPRSRSWRRATSSLQRSAAQWRRFSPTPRSAVMCPSERILIIADSEAAGTNTVSLDPLCGDSGRVRRSARHPRLGRSRRGSCRL